MLGPNVPRYRDGAFRRLDIATRARFDLQINSESAIENETQRLRQRRNSNRLRAMARDEFDSGARIPRQKWRQRVEFSQFAEVVVGNTALAAGCPLE